jgi:hypothetical protein
LIALANRSRWGTIPIVKAAQEEKIIDIPVELEIPWRYLCRHFGLYSQGGNVTSNYFCNFNDRDQIVYQINEDMSEVTRTAEYHFGHVFPAIEKAVSDQTGSWKKLAS